MAADVVVPGAVIRAAMAVRQQLLTDEGKPLVPIGAACRPHGLNGVIVPVEVVNVGTAERHVKGAVTVLLTALPAQQILEPFFHFHSLVDAGAIKGDNA